MKLLKLFLATTALFASTPTVRGVEYMIDPWAPPDPWGEGYPSIDVYPGDCLTFKWNNGGEYNVWQYPSLSCYDDANAVWIGASSGATYTFTEWDGTPEGKATLFVCNLSDYCEQGMNVRVNIFSGTAPPTDPWAAPPTYAPTHAPSVPQTHSPTYAPSYSPTYAPVAPPTNAPTHAPPSDPPTYAPTYPTVAPPTYAPTYAYAPSYSPVASPTYPPTYSPTASPVGGGGDGILQPTQSPTTPPVQENNQDPKEILIDNWDIPEDTQPFPPIEANVGDTIKFLVNPGHDVFIHPSSTCDDETGAVFVGNASVPAEYTFQDADAGTTMMFICGVGTHCSLGMQLAVSVTGNVPDVPEDGVADGIDFPDPPAEPQNFQIDWSIPADTTLRSNPSYGWRHNHLFHGSRPQCLYSSLWKLRQK